MWDRGAELVIGSHEILAGFLLSFPTRYITIGVQQV